MQKPGFDPGLTQQFGAPLRRTINKDGSFSVRRSGSNWGAFHPWLRVVSMTWWEFVGLVLCSYLLINTIFAVVYFSLDPGEILGSAAATESGRFLNDWFFSAHTLTTVGYGTLAPQGVASNAIASLEALVGLMGFAIGTGLLLARISRPTARIGFSPNALVTRYQSGTSLQFRIANQRKNNLMELEARVLLMTVVDAGGAPKRQFDVLKLERDSVLFFPLTWTIVHPIEEGSPLLGKSAADLEQLQAEVLILIKGFDETFSQMVQARYSYRYDELLWGPRFAPAFHVDSAGEMVLELDRLGELIESELQAG